MKAHLVKIEVMDLQHDRDIIQCAEKRPMDFDWDLNDPCPSDAIALTVSYLKRERFRFAVTTSYGQQYGEVKFYIDDNSKELMEALIDENINTPLIKKLMHENDSLLHRLRMEEYNHNKLKGFWTTRLVFWYRRIRCSIINFWNDFKSEL